MLRLAAAADVYCGSGAGMELLRCRDPSLSLILQAKVAAARELCEQRDLQLVRNILRGLNGEAV